MTDIAGDFETHITVVAAHEPALRAFAAENDLKCLVIELDRGRNQVQPMLTLRGGGTLAEQRDVAAGWVTLLRRAGMRATRVKIEAAPWSRGVPEEDSAAPGDLYFEHHIKVLLPPGGEHLPAITGVAERHGARLSRNARRRHDDGTAERFVNQRCHGVGRVTASARLDRLVADLRALGREIVSVEQEYVVHDDNLEYDAGWLDAGDGAPVTRRT